nr:MAG TPA: hypothetical protein [Caudoviricetes sp.]
MKTVSRAVTGSARICPDKGFGRAMPVISFR